MTPSPKQLVAIGALVTMWVLESLVPFFPGQIAHRRQRLAHDGRNFVWGIVNTFIGTLLVSTTLVAVTSYATEQGWGLLRLVKLPAAVKWGLALLLFDLWMYSWHRINHVVPFLWRFHRMHHSDRAMDTSTGVRFHPGEIVLSSFARLLVLPLLGISIEQLVAYEMILLPVICFHHSNLRLPRWVDYGLAWVMVSPAVHRVHHSQIVRETNSNYGSVLSCWDRLAGTLRMRNDVENIEYGLPDFDGPEFDGPDSDSLAGMATTPLTKRPRR